MTESAKKILSYLFKATILVLASLFIYNRINNNENLTRFQNLINHIGSRQVMLTMASVIALMFINWIIESFKWKYLTRTLTNMTTWEAIEAVFHGLTWAIFTPNRLGEYGGRVLFLPNRKRILGVFAMAVGAFGQNVITNILGLSALIWFNFQFLHLNIIISVALSIMSLGFMVLLVIFYVNIKWLVYLLNKISFLKKYHRFFDIIGRYKTRELFIIMGFCLSRFFVFSFQYYLIIHLLIPTIPVFEMLMMMFIVFFIQSALPSLDLLDIGVRTVTASTFFAYITNQELAVIASITAIWLINLIIPAILGSVFVLKLKFFDRTA